MMLKTYENDTSPADSIGEAHGLESESLVETVLSRLRSGMLAERIMDAARLAAAGEMLLKAQAMQSAVEAENSTK